MGTPLNSNQIVVGGNGTVWVAPLDTTQPTNPTAAPVAAWLKLGYVTDAGATITDTKALNPIPAWQSFYAVRQIIASREFTVAFGLLQWSQDTVKLAFGGGTISNPSAGVFKFVPPSPEDVDYRMLMLDWVDDTKNYRLIVPKGLSTETVNPTVARTDAAILPITFAAVPATGTDAYVLYTDDPSFSS